MIHDYPKNHPNFPQNITAPVVVSRCHVLLRLRPRRPNGAGPRGPRATTATAAQCAVPRAAQLGPGRDDGGSGGAVSEGAATGGGN